MSVRRPRFEEETAAETINISPLIDVIFILLIFFIVTMVFADGSAMNLDVPRASNVRGVDSSAVTVAILPDGSLEIDGKNCASAMLESVLRKRMADSRSVVVRSDSKVPVSRLVEVMDIAKTCGAREIYVAADKK